MEALIKSLVDVLAGLGLAGVLIAGQAYYIYYLVTKKDELQEARLQEYKLLVTTVTANTEIMRELKQTITYCEKTTGKQNA